MLSETKSASCGKKLFLVLSLLLITYCRINPATTLFAAIRLGVDIETGGTSYSNPNYSTSSTLSNSYNYQKSRLYLEGDLKKNVTVGVKLLSRGIFGKEFGKEYTTAKSSITFINSTPQIENAFLEFSDINNLPIDFIVGRQPIKIGQGVLVDDDGLGFDALRVKAYLPFDIDVDGFLIKRTELSGTQFTKDTDDSLKAIGGNWTYENNYNFRVYYFIEDSSSTLKKNFISVRADGRFKEGVDYRLELIKSGGDYSGISYLIGVTAYTKVKKLGNTSVNFEYAVGSGKENMLGFVPTYGHKTDGFERSGYGEYFGASMTDFYGGIPRKEVYQGIHTTLLGIGFEPHKTINLNFDYYILFSIDSPAGLVFTDRLVGDELDMALKYKYTDNCYFKFTYDIFRPLKILKENATAKISASKIGWSVSAKF
ncbi:MAG: alginate export family protein [Elusimicrobiota bacterium]